MAQPLLRAALPGDADALARLARLTFQETFVEDFGVAYPAEDLAAFVAQTYAPATFHRELADPAQAAWVVAEGCALLAYAQAGPCGLPHAQVRPGAQELRRLYVARGAQGQGLGGRLLQAALDWMERQGPEPLWLGVWCGNVRAQAVYESRGFRIVGGYQFPVGAWRDEEFIMRRDRADDPI